MKNVAHMVLESIACKTKAHLQKSHRSGQTRSKEGKEERTSQKEKEGRTKARLKEYIPSYTFRFPSASFASWWMGNNHDEEKYGK
jgi:hypothetical protein